MLSPRNGGAAKRSRKAFGRVGPAIAILALASLLLTGSPAAASYQQVGNFAGVPGQFAPSSPQNGEGSFPEQVQLGSVSGMAINYTGAGGVPAGTVYAVGGVLGAGPTVARYKPDRSFSESWRPLDRAREEAREAEGKDPYERCGPEGAPAYPHCRPNANMGGSGPSYHDVDVNQTTGDVYVLSYEGGMLPGTPLITVYSPDGSEVIARFGEKAPWSTDVLASPAMIHEMIGGGNVAVNAAGEVYVFDFENRKDFYHRMMVFKPKSPGDYSEYEYAGQAHDVLPGYGFETPYLRMLMTDAAGYVYTGTDEGVQKYDPTHPTDPAICKFKFKKGGVESMAINPLTGEVFLSSYVTSKLHRLNPCVEGKFSEAETIEFSPPRGYLSAMAVDPVTQFGPGRAPGVLFAGAPSGEGGPNEGAELEGSMGYVFAPPPEVPPLVVSESASSVTQSSARLEGVVDPRGNPTIYAFQYISEAAYEENEPSERFAGGGEAPTGGARIEGSKAIPVAATVGGLAPDTKYRYRIVATSHCSPSKPEEECVGEGEARTFHTYPLESAGPPDQRGYELVSPVRKAGGQVLPAEPGISSCGGFDCKPGNNYVHYPPQSVPDGNAVVFEGEPFSDEGAGVENEYIARRSGSGWHTTTLSPNLFLSGNGNGYRAFSSDLSVGLIGQFGRLLAPEAPVGYDNLYSQSSTEPGEITPLLTEAPPNRSPTGSNRLVLSYAGASTDFSRLFFVANDTLTPEAEGGPEAKTNLYESSGGELHLVNFAPGDATTIPGAKFGRGTGGVQFFHAISEDGSRAYWSSESDQVYVRENGAVTRELTDHTGRFLSASADGSRALLDDGCLYGLEAEACEDLTQGQGGFQGLVGQSEDLSRIYFVDTQVLSGEEENEYGDKAVAGKFNLYAWHEGQVAFLALLSQGKDGSDWVPDPSTRSASASPDGKWLAFISFAPLTGFDNTGLCQGVSGTPIFLPGLCEEVFLYQAETGELRCPSCNRTGVAPLGPSVLRRGQSPRYLTNAGRLLFDSTDSLSPFDTNGRVEDVYEFEPKGVGTCAEETGCVRLISAGRSGVDSNFLTMDSSGRNVFFTSRDQLVAADKDDLIDLYDAREGGGFADEVVAGECQGEACLPSVSPPNDPTPASAGFRGPGNRSGGEGTKRCPRGRHSVKRKGKARCVKRHSKRRHKRAHGNHGGAK